MASEASFDPERSALFTDLYELTMLQAYHAEGMEGEAVFELFFRELPRGRHYVMAAGLDDVLRYLEGLRFGEDDIAWLRGTGQFSEPFLRWLASFRFTGELHAVAEGTVVFPHEPVIQVVAPLPQAQLVETYLLNQFHLQSLAATKAARVITAARGRTVVDFGSRRSHGADAALKVARCSYLAGAAGTSNVAAGRRYGIPVFGTMAHSYIQAHESEMDAFRAFARQFPATTLLVDTYDTREGVARVVALAQELGEDFHVRAVRLDSGDLARLAVEARRALDEAGLGQVQIFASGGLEEYKLDALLVAGAPIDGFGVGTEMAVSGDAPVIDYSYKLVSYDGRARMKLSSSKLSRPGRKQVFRRYQDGRMMGDTIALHDETLEGEALLRPVMRGGRILDGAREDLEAARRRARDQLEALPRPLRALRPGAEAYRPGISAGLEQLTAELRRTLERGA